MTEQEYNEVLKSVMKMYNRKQPNIPARIIDNSIDSILRVYGASYKRLFGDLLEALNDDFGLLATPSYQSQLSMLKLVESRMGEIDGKVMNQIQKELEKSYASAHAFHGLSIATIKTLEQLKGEVPFSTLDTYKMEQIVQDTMEDLLFVTQHTSKEIKKVIRDTFAKNLHYHALREESQKNIKRIIERQLSKGALKEALEKNGFVGIIDSKGRKWNLKTYVDMAVSTKMNQAYVEGLKDRANATGYDLAVIPNKGASDTCAYFEGMIISLTGGTKGYKTYDDLQATGLIFHPRCVHSPFPVGNPDLLPDEDVKAHNKKVQELNAVTIKKKKS